MDDYLNLFREMISLRSLTEHTAKSYSTYIKTYLFISPRFFTRLRRRFPGLICVSLSGGFKERKAFLTEQSITVFPSFAFSLCMSFISPGIPLSFPCEILIPTFLYILIIFEKSIVIMFFALFRNFFDYIFISQFSHLSIPGKSTFFSVPKIIFRRPGACWRSMMKVIRTVRKPDSGPYSRKAGRMKAAGIRTAPKGR